MEDFNKPKCSRDPDPIPHIQQENPSASKEIPTDQSTQSISEALKSFSSPSTYSSNLSSQRILYTLNNLPVLIRSSILNPINVPSKMSILNTALSMDKLNQPQSLFLLALTKLNESSVSFALINHINELFHLDAYKTDANSLKSGELTPPDSLESAPPSYSFVLRQMAVRRRPRLMGTFIPSPSFVQHTPPPTYATAFDIYIDNPIPPPTRTYTFGFTSMLVVCPECGYTGMTEINSKITICTHLCALVLCLFCCWVCAPLPYVLKSCKDVYHYCRNCRNFLGMYCQTNPHHSYPYT